VTAVLGIECNYKDRGVCIGKVLIGTKFKEEDRLEALLLCSMRLPGDQPLDVCICPSSLPGAEEGGIWRVVGGDAGTRCVTKEVAERWECWHGGQNKAEIEQSNNKARQGVHRWEEAGEKPKTHIQRRIKTKKKHQEWGDPTGRFRVRRGRKTVRNGYG